MEIVPGSAGRQVKYRPGEQTGIKGLYFGEEPPGLTPKIFAPTLVSLPETPDYSGTFSPDAREFYFTRGDNITVSRLLEEGWTAPEPVTFHAGNAAHEPHVTADGKTMYFGWFRGEGGGRGYGIWACDRQGNAWSAPRYVGDGMDVTSDDHGTIYVTGKPTDRSINVGVVRAILENGRFIRLERLNGGMADPPPGYTGSTHPAVSPDGRVMVYDANGGRELFVSFLGQDGVWGEPISLAAHGLPLEAAIAWFSPDGKYFFYTFNPSGTAGRSDIYWVSADFVYNLKG